MVTCIIDEENIGATIAKKKKKKREIVCVKMPMFASQETIKDK